MLCQVLSFANCKDQPCQTPKQIVANIAALRYVMDPPPFLKVGVTLLRSNRIKVGKTTASRAMLGFFLTRRRGTILIQIYRRIRYEISLRGAWPADYCETNVPRWVRFLRADVTKLPSRCLPPNSSDGNSRSIRATLRCSCVTR